MAWIPGTVNAHFINEFAHSGGLSWGNWTSAVAVSVIGSSNPRSTSIVASDGSHG
jgi:hypothetical protein